MICSVVFCRRNGCVPICMQELNCWESLVKPPPLWCVDLFFGQCVHFKKEMHWPYDQISSCGIRTANNLASSRLWWLSFVGMYTWGGPSPGWFPPTGVNYLIEGQGNSFCSICYHDKKIWLKDTDSSWLVDQEIGLDKGNKWNRWDATPSILLWPARGKISKTDF